MILISCSIVIKSVHVKIMSSISERFSSSSFDSSISTARACWSSAVIRCLITHVIHDKICFASFQKSAICSSIQFIISLYAWSYASDSVRSFFKAVQMILNDLFSINESRWSCASKNLSNVSAFHLIHKKTYTFH